jgi:hypothetical protein
MKSFNALNDAKSPKPNAKYLANTVEVYAVPIIKICFSVFPAKLINDMRNNKVENAQGFIPSVSPAKNTGSAEIVGTLPLLF